MKIQDMPRKSTTQQRVMDILNRYAQTNNLKVGDKLPPVRKMARHFGVGHVTMAKAIQKLSEQGQVITNGKAGTTLTDKFPTTSSSTTHNLVLIEAMNLHENSRYVDETELYARILRGAKTILPNLQFSTFWNTQAENTELLDRILQLYHPLVLRNEVTFLLGGANFWVKEYFQKRNLPAIILGGAEDGITLPSVGIDTAAVTSELKRVCDLSDAFPITHMTFAPVGEHYAYNKAFTEWNTIPGKSCGKISVFKLTDLPEIKNAQIRQLLTSPSRPRTIIISGYIEGLSLCETCKELGIRIPEDLQIISLEQCISVSYTTPKLTAFFRDHVEMGLHIGELICDIKAHKDVENQHLTVKPFLIFNDTFQMHNDH